MEEAAYPYKRWLNLLFWSALGGLLAFMALGQAALINYSYVWDDSYMFVRYADHLMRFGKLAWNPHGPPTYGLTSMLYLIVVTPVAALLPGQPVLAAMASSVFCGILFIALTALMLHRLIDTTRPEGKALFLFLFFSLGYGYDSLAYHLASGMDTTFALSYLTLYLILAEAYTKNKTLARAIIAGLVGGLAWWARPDLCLFTTLAPACIVLLGRDRAHTKTDLMLAGATIATLMAVWASSYLYFGSALPLPFYGKSTGLYGAEIARVYRTVPYKELAGFFTSYWYLFVMVGAGAWLGRKRWRKSGAGLEAGLLAAAVLFILYYLFFVTQIMYTSHRFYYPVLPALVFLSARVSSIALGVEGGAKGQEPVIKAPAAAWLVAVIFIGFAFSPDALAIAKGFSSMRAGGNIGRMGIEECYRRYWSRYWFRLDEFSRLPDKMTIATTEVGMPGVLNLNRTIIDMAGLHDTEFGKNGFSVDVLLGKYKPDLIYMPFPDYKAYIEAIENDPRFKQGYDYYPAKSIKRTMGVALRVDSPYYRELKAIAEKGPEEMDL